MVFPGDSNTAMASTYQSNSLKKLHPQYQLLFQVLDPYFLVFVFGKIFQVYCRHLKLDTIKRQFVYRFRTIRGKKKKKKNKRTKTSQVSSTKDRKGKIEKN